MHTQTVRKCSFSSILATPEDGETILGEHHLLILLRCSLSSLHAGRLASWLAVEDAAKQEMKLT